MISPLLKSPWREIRSRQQNCFVVCTLTPWNKQYQPLRNSDCSYLLQPRFWFLRGLCCMVPWRTISANSRSQSLRPQPRCFFIHVGWLLNDGSGKFSWKVHWLQNERGRTVMFPFGFSNIFVLSTSMSFKETYFFDHHVLFNYLPFVFKQQCAIAPITWIYFVFCPGVMICWGCSIDVPFTVIFVAFLFSFKGKLYVQKEDSAFFFGTQGCCLIASQRKRLESCFV